VNAEKIARILRAAKRAAKACDAEAEKLKAFLTD